MEPRCTKLSHVRDTIWYNSDLPHRHFVGGVILEHCRVLIFQVCLQQDQVWIQRNLEGQVLWGAVWLKTFWKSTSWLSVFDSTYFVSSRQSMVFYGYYFLQCGAPQLQIGLKTPLTIVISTINHSYWSYVHQRFVFLTIADNIASHQNCRVHPGGCAWIHWRAPGISHDPISGHY